MENHVKKYTGILVRISDAILLPASLTPHFTML